MGNRSERIGALAALGAARRSGRRRQAAARLVASSAAAAGRHPAHQRLQPWRAPRWPWETPDGRGPWRACLVTMACRPESRPWRIHRGGEADPSPGLLRGDGPAPDLKKRQGSHLERLAGRGLDVFAATNGRAGKAMWRHGAGPATDRTGHARQFHVAAARPMPALLLRADSQARTQRLGQAGHPQPRWRMAWRPMRKVDGGEAPLALMRHLLTQQPAQGSLAFASGRHRRSWTAPTPARSSRPASRGCGWPSTKAACGVAWAAIDLGRWVKRSNLLECPGEEWGTARVPASVAWAVRMATRCGGVRVHVGRTETQCQR